ncbi:MAG: ABC transporter ATP-binding protein [Candidatus Komeilibacteria bacterium]|nr:ABC transporter ATP-binding protein [Candidatus Komeilibacteria bacterium]
MSIIPKENRIRAVIGLSRKAFFKYKWQILSLTALGLVSGFLEGIGVNALIPLFSLAADVGSSGDDLVTRTIMELFARFNLSFSLKYLLIFIITLFILKALVIIWFNYIKIKITADYEHNTQTALFKQTLKSHWPYLLKQKIGYLEKVLMTDVAYSSSLLQQLGSIIMILTGLLMYMLIAFNISVTITLITLTLGAVLFLVLKPFTYRTRKAAHEKSELNKETSHHINENILGLKTIKSFLVDNNVSAAAAAYFKRMKELNISVYMTRSITGSLMQPISLIFICAVFAFSYRSPDFNFAAMIAVVYLIQKMFQYIQQLQTAMHHLSESIPYLKSVLNYQQKADDNREEPGGEHAFKFEKSLEFKGVSFFYNPAAPVLDQLDFSVNKGEMVGLIGASGSGKTTISDLLLRLFNPSAGAVLLDGINAEEIKLKDWRFNIGYVSQDIFLVNDTIASNIKFYNEDVSDAQIHEAAKMANIDEFIQGLPEKYNTIVGERGTFLSGGQRQRIIIARVLARKPQLLILDEATSALDNESEVKIQEVIDGLKGKLTVFVIAHRLSTVLNSDKLLVLAGGKIVEQGRPAELLKDKETYFSKAYNIRT